jgi:small-conductance mechanosensitive channel
MTANSAEQLISKLFDIGVNFMLSSVRILLIVIVAYFGAKLLRKVLGHLEAFLVRTAAASEKMPDSAGKRIRTLTSVIWTLASGLIWFIAVLVSLDQIGVNLGPILAGAGIVGLAVGFGAQHLVRDLVSGFFLILENQIRVGDAAVINGTSGMVEAISFRTVVLRDMAGALHIFPNGSIKTLSNMSKDWSAYIIDLPVAYKEDTDRVIEIMRQVADEMRSEPPYGSLILEPIEIMGVDAFTDTGVTIKARFKTQPLQQHVVGREYRRRVKKAFESAGVEIPPSPRAAGNSPSKTLS